MQQTINAALLWRYATKIFDPAKKIPEADIQSILEAIRLTPSSFGLPLWKAVIITNSDVRTKLRAAAWDQSQVTDASHLVVFAINTSINESMVDTYIAEIAKVRSIPVEALDGFSAMMKGFIASKDPSWLLEWATRQAYIALGFALETAALHTIDSCPLEGFDPASFDAILDLPKHQLASKVILALGYRSESDQSSLAAKVRFPHEDTFLYIN